MVFLVFALYILYHHGDDLLKCVVRAAGPAAADTLRC